MEADNHDFPGSIRILFASGVDNTKSYIQLWFQPNILHSAQTIPRARARRRGREMGKLSRHPF